MAGSDAVVSVMVVGVVVLGQERPGMASSRFRLEVGRY